MLCLWSAKGGVGCSVAAAALALLRVGRGPVLLVDLDGDLGRVLGVTDDAEGRRTGLARWIGSDNPPPQSLQRLEVPVVDGLSLLPWDASEIRGDAQLSQRADLLARLLAADPRTVIVDLGLRRGHFDAPFRHHLDRGLLRSSSRSILVTRACYLALRSARQWDRPDAVIVIEEAGRALRKRDISAAVGAPVEASVRWDPGVARRVDAGLLAARVPRALRSLEGVRS